MLWVGSPFCCNRLYMLDCEALHCIVTRYLSYLNLFGAVFIIAFPSFSALKKLTFDVTWRHRYLIYLVIFLGHLPAWDRTNRLIEQTELFPVHYWPPGLFVECARRHFRSVDRLLFVVAHYSAWHVISDVWHCLVWWRVALSGFVAHDIRITRLKMHLFKALTTTRLGFTHALFYLVFEYRDATVTTSWCA